MSRTDDANDLPCGIGNLAEAADRKVKRLHVVRTGEISRHRVGDEDRVVRDLRLPEGLATFLEGAYDREGDTFNGHVVADCSIDRTEHLLGEWDGNNGALEVSRGIAVIEKAAREKHEVADLAILRADAEDEAVLDDAAAKTDALVRLKNRRRVEHAGHLREHRRLIVARQGVVIEHARGTRRSAA